MPIDINNKISTGLGTRGTSLDNHPTTLLDGASGELLAAEQEQAASAGKDPVRAAHAAIRLAQARTALLMRGRFK